MTIGKPVWNLANVRKKGKPGPSYILFPWALENGSHHGLVSRLMRRIRDMYAQVAMIIVIDSGGSYCLVLSFQTRDSACSVLFAWFCTGALETTQTNSLVSPNPPSLILYLSSEALPRPTSHPC